MTMWPTCEVEACAGVKAKGFDRCLGHLSGDQLEQFLDALQPKADLDARGTTVTASLLAQLIPALGEFGHLDFTKAQFEDVEEVELLGDRLTLDRAKFARWVHIGGRADYVSCVGTQFVGGVRLQVSYAAVDASEATFGDTSMIATSHRYAPWPRGGKWDREWEERFAGTGVRLFSLRGCDVRNLVLVNVDLSWCLFAGAHRLDQLRLEGRCRFNTERAHWWWTRRQKLAEEYLSFTQQQHPHLGVPVAAGPARVAGLYRSLRKAFEDSKNEAGAGDFYYGEMEMRRQSPATPLSERWILTAYWLLSGYGQRAARALAALVVVIATVSVLLFTVGLPGEPVWAGPRVEQSARIALGAVVLRDAGQQLTSAGSWTVMVARVVGPVLLALAVLAVRARVKR
ncbi:MAG TPA: hypothetical protein VGX25_00740 [Actinophytocola sp.]|uniref:hypothetical protein n=1 Tax=Actinophytocola sp. TaxID=1872138 RepID=UPI002DDD3F5D|nr:hypothetical protein [Actinophytocola sp.]HEV2777904.1 hypothetical protein [Actinophytocola sp.]